MGWIIWIVFLAITIVSGIHREQRAGLWSWSKFAFTLGFAAVACALLLAPLVFLSLNSPYFWWAFGAAWVVVAALFVWFIVKCRSWKLPDGRTSLEAYRDARRQGQ